MELMLGDNKIKIEIIRKNNKNAYFRFKEDNVLYVTCNRWMSENDIIKFIRNNEKSFLRMYNEAWRKNNNELQFTYLGKPYIKVFDDDIKDVVIEDNYIYFKNEKMFDKWYKNECLRVFKERIDYCLKGFSNIPSFALRIRKMSTRWGVNNVTKKIITLNSELLKKDIDLIDYVVIHELCHFYEANHSDRFWYQVSLRYPEYKLARKRLRG